MFNWEMDALKAIPRFKEAGGLSVIYWTYIKEGLVEVLGTYCTPRERPDSLQLAVGTPQHYNPKQEHILEVTYPLSYEAHVLTERMGGRKGRELMQRNRYVLMKCGDKWLVDNKKCFDIDGNLEHAIL